MQRTNSIATCVAALLTVSLLIVGFPTLGLAAEWRPGAGRLLSRWAKDVTPENALPEYPRPQMVRPEWQNLNGLWDYAVRLRQAAMPAECDGQILVPFPVESALSGVMQPVGDTKRLWYRRTFDMPTSWDGQRVLLHFGAVDFEATIWIDAQEVGTHRGGYDPFVFDITDALKAAVVSRDATAPEDAGAHEIVVAVWDPTDKGTQARGKQVSKPHGIWYTSTTGIWQTVWLEPVPATSIAGLKMVPNIDDATLRLIVDPRGPFGGCTIEATVHDGNHQVAQSEGKPAEALTLAITQPKLWSPDSPFLYDLTVKLLHNGKVVDEVSSYFGMRKIALGKDARGITRLMLNNEPVFHFGPLDQGFWPDGLYTAPTDEALRFDIALTKRLGFNMVRKHVKVEPARWYMWCDRLGLLVWQDLPNSDRPCRWPYDGTEIERSRESAELYRSELKALIDTHGNAPSIVMWVPFNEAWGQFDTEQIAAWVKAYDPSRLVNAASGGNDFGVGDVHDIHRYPGPAAPPAQTARAAVLGEFGGLGLPLAGHTLLDEKNWGYVSYKNTDELTAAYMALLGKLRPLIDSHLAAAVYTQTTDVEVEVNGLVTYDRVVVKFAPEKLAAANREMLLPLQPVAHLATALASTVAYWRFEGGKVGVSVPHRLEGSDATAATVPPATDLPATDLPVTIAVRDVSGHQNHLFAFATANAPRLAADVPAAVVPLTHQPNRLCLDDRPPPTAGADTRDLFTDPWQWDSMVRLDAFQFTQWTVEASVCVDQLGQRHVIVGKDGIPTKDISEGSGLETSGPKKSNIAPLQLAVTAANQIEVSAVDRTGTLRRLVAARSIVAGKWYHVAAVCDGKTLRLLVDSNDGNGYVRVGKTESAGGLVNTTAPWTVGCGWVDGKIGNDAQAMIDEVRISAIALPADQLLFAPGP